MIHPSGPAKLAFMRVGIAHHLGWAVAVTVSADHEVVDRRHIELVEPDVAVAPVEHEVEGLDDTAATELVAMVRASAVCATAAALDEMAASVPEPIVSVSLAAWPPDFPVDIAVQRRAPYNARADSVMYRQVLDEVARGRGWDVYLYDSDVLPRAARLLGGRAQDVLFGPRTRLGPPWTRDHRVALAAALLAG